MATATKTKVDPEDLVDIPAGAKLVWVRPKTIANWLTQGKLTSNTEARSPTSAPCRTMTRG
jgi:hypothetical protein